MRRRLALLVLVLCLGLDFASPMVPGAFCFDIDSSVAGVRTPRARTPAVGLGPVLPPAPGLPEVRVVRAARIQPLLTAPVRALLLPPSGVYPPAAPDTGRAADEPEPPSRPAPSRTPLHGREITPTGKETEMAKRGYEGLGVSLVMMAAAFTLIAILKLML